MKYNLVLEFDSKSKSLPETLTNAKFLSLVVNKLSKDFSKANLLAILEESESEFSLSDLKISCDKVTNSPVAGKVSQEELDNLLAQVKQLTKDNASLVSKLNKINQLSQP
jgi:hypothetical protein